MIRRYWRKLFALIVVLLLAAAGYYWWATRPVPAAQLSAQRLSNGSDARDVVPGTRTKSRVAIALPAAEALTDKQLLDLSRDASAHIVQVILPETDCSAQQAALNAAIERLDAKPDLVAGIGPGASLAWRWLATQDNDKAQAVSVDLSVEKPDGCVPELPKKAEHGQWMVAWNDNPDDASAAFVRDQPNAQTVISDYDVKLPQVLKNQITDILVGDEGTHLAIPVVEVPATQSNDTVSLFLSGDGGWRDLDKAVAGDMATMGYPTVGIDTLRYYWEHKTPEQSADDLVELMHYYRQKWGAKRFVLTGYSFGADVLPAIYNRLPAEEQNSVSAIILLAFARSGSFEIEVEGWLGNAGKEAPTGPEMAKLPAAKVVCVYGEEEADESGCTEATAVGEKMKLPGGHHFDENYPALAKRLVQQIDKRTGSN
ncbi:MULTISPECIES: virulence factor family protein [Pseudomonas]|uniref:virulence factor family protein n=1 Tax=Pseudomonas TaxID=286 RepID=UPI00257D20AE|nr:MULTISPECIES: AcvB/VirJ family lysyl-phosphatidylglycerol hydrolase [Pseudomonas]